MPLAGQHLERMIQGVALLMAFSVFSSKKHDIKPEDIVKAMSPGYHTKNEVIHLHVHLIPMYNEDDENPGRIRSLMPE